MIFYFSSHHPINQHKNIFVYPVELETNYFHEPYSNHQDYVIIQLLNIQLIIMNQRI